MIFDLSFGPENESDYSWQIETPHHNRFQTIQFAAERKTVKPEKFQMY